MSRVMYLNMILVSISIHDVCFLVLVFTEFGDLQLLLPMSQIVILKHMNTAQKLNKNKE